MRHFLLHLTQQENSMEDSNERNDEEQLEKEEEEEEEEEEIDECGLIYNQNCQDDGLCEYCAMCLRDSCIMDTIDCALAITNETNLYDWFGYCLLSENGSNKSHCATHVECYQYYKTSGRSTAHAWHSLTCNPTNCMLVGNTRNASPTSVPLPPVKLPNPYNQPRRADRHQEKTYSSAIIASCCILCGLFIAILFWFCRKRRWLTFQKAKQGHCESISYMPASAPPSFRTIPSCIIARASCRSSQTLPSYVSACHSPPKYEQAIVTQIRDQPESVIVQHDPRYSNDMLSS